LNDAFRALHGSKAHVFHLVRKISGCVSNNVCNSFFDKQEQSLYLFYQKEKNRVSKKMKGLLKKQTKDSISLAKNIRYYYYTPSNTSYSIENNIEQFSFTFLLNCHVRGSKLVEVNVDPKNHLATKKFSPLDSLNNKWFINWSHEHIPDNTQQLLQLGHNFSLPSVNSNNNIIQTIKNIENNIIK